jgi:hypothetical protein
MYWSGCQSTGADMRKYLTAGVLVGDTKGSMHQAERTVVDLLQGNDTVWREALLGVLV